jgi:predicted Zn-dependent protease
MPEAPESPPFPGPVSVEESSMFREHEGSDEWTALEEGYSSYSLYTKFARTQLYGSMTSSESVIAMASSNGLFLYQPSSLAHLQVRGYSSDGSSTGFAERYTIDRASMNATEVLRNAAENCITWIKPIEFKPKRVTTIFEPRALADILRPMLGQFSRRAIEMDQSFLRRLDGTSFLGKRMFKEQVTLRSNPFDTRIPSLPFTSEGQPVRAETWVDKGVIAQLIADRYDAAEYGTTEVAPPTNLTMDVADPVKDLVADTEEGLLVKGFANLNILDPKNCLVSGSTRDGVYLIEKGQITKAVRNLIIRETPVYFFKEVQAMGRPELTSTTGSYFPMLLPPIRVKDVMFTQLSGLI